MLDESLSITRVPVASRIRTVSGRTGGHVVGGFATLTAPSWAFTMTSWLPSGSRDAVSTLFESSQVSSKRGCTSTPMPPSRCSRWAASRSSKASAPQ